MLRTAWSWISPTTGNAQAAIIALHVDACDPPYPAV